MLNTDARSSKTTCVLYLINTMPENTFIYDTVYEEFREELQFTDDEMSEAIMFWEDRSLFDELMYRVKRRKWQEEQRNKWIQGEQPEYKIPEDCPF